MSTRRPVASSSSSRGFRPVYSTRRAWRNTGEANGVRVSRISRVEVEGRLSRLLFDYEITDGVDTRRAQEVHELGLFTTAELLQTFRDVGLDTDDDPKGLTDRGLYMARAAA